MKTLREEFRAFLYGRESDLFEDETPRKRRRKARLVRTKGGGTTKDTKR